MSKEKAFEFLMGADEALVAKISEASDPAAAMVEAAAAAGHSFTGEDLAQALTHVNVTDELTEEEMGEVAGGIPGSGPLGITPANPIGVPASTPVGLIVNMIQQTG